MQDAEAAAALKEPVLAQGRCIYMGEAHSPEFNPHGPTFHGFALAGETKFGFVNDDYQKACWASCNYESISRVAYRSEEKVTTPRWVVEFANQPVEGHFAGRTIHACVCLPLPAVVGPPTVTDVILTRIREQSRFDMSKHFTAEETSEGLILLPITPDATKD